jgi:signal transduction histidine kinase
VRSPNLHRNVSPDRSLVQRVRKVIGFGCLAIGALITTASPALGSHLQPILVAIVFLLCAWAVYRLVAVHARGEADRENEIALAARLDGVTLAARTLRHHLGNRLAVTLGYSEILADDPRLPEDLEEHAHKIMASARAAADTLDEAQQHMVRLQLDTSLAGPPLLDVQPSTALDQIVDHAADGNLPG